MSAEKVKEHVFVLPQIKKLTKDAQFLSPHERMWKKSMTFLCKNSIKISWQH